MVQGGTRRYNEVQGGAKLYKNGVYGGTRQYKNGVWCYKAVQTGTRKGTRMYKVLQSSVPAPLVDGLSADEYAVVASNLLI